MSDDYDNDLMAAQMYADIVRQEIRLLRIIMLKMGKFDAKVLYYDEGGVYVCTWGVGSINIPASLTEEEQANLLTIALKTSC